jgi:hypothetical protein
VVEIHVFVVNSLLDVYAKCGSIARCFESVQQVAISKYCVEQDAILKCGYLDGRDVGICEMWARIEGTGAVFAKCNSKARYVTRLCFDNRFIL